MRIPFKAVSKTPINPFAAALLGVGAAYLIWKLSHTLLLTFAGVLLAIFLRRLANKLTLWTHLPRTPALLVVVTGIIAAVVLLFVLLGAQTAEQLAVFSAELPKSVQNVEATIRNTTVGGFVLEQIELGSGQQANVVSALRGTLSKTFSGLFDIFVILSVALFLALDPDLYRRGLIRLVPCPPSADNRGARHFAEGLWKWIPATMLSSAIVGVAGIGRAPLGVPLAAALGVMAGLTNIIPNFGPLIAGGTAAILAFSVSPTLALATVALFVVINQVERELILP